MKRLFIALILSYPCFGMSAEMDSATLSQLSKPLQKAIQYYESGEDIKSMDYLMEILTSGDAKEREIANYYINKLSQRMNTVKAEISPAFETKPLSVVTIDGKKPVSRSRERKKRLYLEQTVKRSEELKPQENNQRPPAPETTTPAAPLVTEKSVSDEGVKTQPQVPVVAQQPTIVPTPKPAPAVPSVTNTATNSTAVSAAPMPPAATPAPKPERIEPKETHDQETLTADKKEKMAQEIKIRLHAAQERSVSELKDIEGVQVVMNDNGDPEAVAIPSSLLFQSGIAFQRDASKILDPLTKLVFALGPVQVLILPEGSGAGAAKVLDMRRTMGLSAALDQAGVAPVRVHVNLLNNSSGLPKSLSSFKGIVISFEYDQPMALNVDNVVGDEMGPPISLGIYPQQLRPTKNQGVVIEFSVSDSPAGLNSWSFQILQPAQNNGDLVSLQELSGKSAAFHQIFWNARKNYYGEPLPEGRYQCLLTAKDAKNHLRTLQKWILVLPDEGNGDKILNSPPDSNPGDSANSQQTNQTQKESGTQSKEQSSPSLLAPEPESVDIPNPSQAVKAAPKKAVVKRPRIEAKRALHKAKKSPAKKEVKPKEAAAASDNSDNKEEAGTAPQAIDQTTDTPSGNYNLTFNKNTHQMTSTAVQVLAKAAADYFAAPTETIQVIGHADDDETDARTLADRRAKMVAGLLINRYQVDPKNISISVETGGGARVDVVLARNQ